MTTGVHDHGEGPQVRVANEQLQQAERLHREQLALAERIHREQNEPYVIVDIQPSDPTSGTLVVVIENIGPTGARDVRISCDPPLVSGWGDDLTEMLQRALSRTIPMLPPGRRLEFLLDNQDRSQNSDLPTAYTFTVASQGPSGSVESLEYVVDFGTWAESLSSFRVATDGGTTSPSATDKAPVPLREVFDVSTHQRRNLVGSLSCRTRPTSCPGRVGHHAHRHP